MAPIVIDETRIRPPVELDRKELLDQLERIVTSSHFRNSKRYPSFLRFIVERTVEDNTEVLKERNLGTEVFGRPSDYDTSADPIVRVTAGEVRKRIAQYYQTPGHELELRIDLPLGSYVPHFYPAGYLAGQDVHELEGAENSLPLEASVAPITADMVSEDEEVLPKVDPPSVKGIKSLASRWLVVGFSVLLLMAILGASFAGVSLFRRRSHSRGLDYFWQSFTPSNETLIVMGVHFSDATGRALPADPGASIVRNEQQTALSAMVMSDMVPVSDVVSYSKLTDLLTRRSIPYRTKGSTEATLDELRSGPVVLVGGFNNLWTMRLTAALRYRLVPKTETVNEIQDSQHPATTWTFDNLQPAIVNSRDYAIVASYYDTTIEQHVVIAAGIGKNGTLAASEFLTTDRHLKDWLTEEKIPANRNVELVLSTDVLDGEPGPPHVIAFAVW